MARFRSFDQLGLFDPPPAPKRSGGCERCGAPIKGRDITQYYGNVCRDCVERDFDLLARPIIEVNSRWLYNGPSDLGGKHVVVRDSRDCCVVFTLPSAPRTTQCTRLKVDFLLEALPLTVYDGPVPY